ITPRSILTPASSVLTTAQQSLDRISASFERLEKVAPRMEAAADEIAQLAREARLFIPELRKTNDRGQRLRGAMDQPHQDPHTLKALIADLRDNLRAIRPVVDGVGRTVERLEPELVGAARSARQTFDSARSAADAINDVLSPENRKQISELL